jgi:predicted metal-dependent phosphoesterase TrpH
MERKIDLHTHTTASDGIYSPPALIDYARKNGISTLAITDHDTVDGLEEAILYAKSADMELIPGIEFSIDYTGGTFHLVALGIDYRHPGYREVTEWLQHERDMRIVRMVDDLRAHDIAISIDEVRGESAGASIGRPHVARVLVKKGYAPSVPDVFKEYLVKGKPGYAKKKKIALGDALTLIRDSGGISAIAHPISMNFGDFDNFREMVKGFAAEGLQGIEVYASMHTPDEVRKFLEIAEEFGLRVTGGSDFHGDKNERIGFYLPETPIPADILDGLKSIRKK